MRTLLLLRSALNALAALYLLLAPVLPSMRQFLWMGVYAVVDGFLALLLAATIRRKQIGPTLFLATLTGAIVRLIFGASMIAFPAIGVVPLTRVLFAALVAKVALVTGLVGVGYVGWTIWRRRYAESLRLRWLVVMSSAFTILFAGAIALSAEFDLHSQMIVGTYALMFALALAAGGLTYSTAVGASVQRK